MADYFETYDVFKPKIKDCNCGGKTNVYSLGINGGTEIECSKCKKRIFDASYIEAIKKWNKILQEEHYE